MENSSPCARLYSAGANDTSHVNKAEVTCMSVSQLPGMISHRTVGARACRHVLCAVNLLGRDETG